MAHHIPYNRFRPADSCRNCWMLFAGDGYCNYEGTRTKVDCDCVRLKKGEVGQGWAGRRLQDGRSIVCEDCDGKMYYLLNKITFQCPGDECNGKIRKHREIHQGFWVAEEAPM